MTLQDGETIDEAKEDLRKAIELILQDRIEAIPRHIEIKEPLAKKILKNLNAE